MINGWLKLNKTELNFTKSDRSLSKQNGNIDYKYIYVVAVDPACALSVS